MSKATKAPKSNGSRARNRGSALIVSLMVLVGLSLLGLAFVTISETESAIAVNERNAIQTKAIAEAGARSVVEWFQSPTWAESIGIMPSNNPAPAGMKRSRIIPGYTGVYKPDPSQRLCAKPYRPAPPNRFYGDDQTADLTINDTIDATVMSNLNTMLFGANSRTNGRISEIKIYAPPMVGGTLTSDGFWSNGERYGTATIKVTAEKWKNAVAGTAGDMLLASSFVRIVVGEFPMPIPAGPVQTASNANFGGSFDVHWGMQAALGDIDTAKIGTPLPYANAFERPHFERGDPLDPMNGYDREVWPVVGGSTYDNAPFLSELLNKSFGDPWSETRARGTNTNCPCPAYTYNMVEGSKSLASFQNQTTTIYPTQRLVTFPTILYDVWKKIAIQGRAQKGIYYFTFDGASGNFKRNGQGVARAAAYWVNTRAGANLGAGFYFFDTRDGNNPQLTGGGTNAAILTPDLSWNSSDFNGDFLMKGFVYLNASEYKTTGAGGSAPTLPYNMPGEMYRDIGYQKITGAPGGVGAWMLAGGSPVREGAGDGQWGYQDANGNGKFDLVVDGPFTVTAAAAYPGQSTPANVYKPRTWSSTRVPACTIPPVAGAMPATACSEPHEPYLNFIYPAIGSPTGAVTVGWEAAGAETKRPRDLLGSTVPDCSTQPQYCTSNKFDFDGALVNLPAILEGVLYNEGAYQSSGNADYFGSLLIKNNTGATGNPQVWFDEKLIKGNWSPPGMPNVIIYSEQTNDDAN